MDALFRRAEDRDSSGSQVLQFPLLVAGPRAGCCPVSYTHLDVYKRQVLKKRLSTTWFYRGMLVLLPFWVVPVGWLLPKASLMETVVMPQKLAAEWGNFSREAGQALDLSWLGLLYGGIVSFLLVRFGVQYFQERRRLLAGSWLLSDPEDGWQLERLLTEHWIKQPVQLRCSPGLKTPVLLGLHRCTIILPNTALNREELRLILSLSLIHI